MNERPDLPPDPSEEDDSDRERKVPAKHPTGDESDDRDKDEFVDETSEDSFPSSDPPAW